MSARNAIWHLTEILAGDYARSWSIGLWLVIPFGLVGFIAQVVWNLAFPLALLPALSAGIGLAAAKVYSTLDETRVSAEKEPVSVLRDVLVILRTQEELLRQQVRASFALEPHLARAADALKALQSEVKLLSNRQNADANALSSMVEAMPSDETIKHLISEIENLRATQEKFSHELIEALAEVRKRSSREEAVGPVSSELVPPEEPTEFSVILTGAGHNKINVIKAVREVTSLGLKEAKDLVDQAASKPKAVRIGVSKEEAEAIRRKFLDAGATTELK